MFLGALQDLDRGEVWAVWDQVAWKRDFSRRFVEISIYIYMCLFTFFFGCNHGCCIQDIQYVYFLCFAKWPSTGKTRVDYMECLPEAVCLKLCSITCDPMPDRSMPTAVAASTSMSSRSGTQSLWESILALHSAEKELKSS